jgi:hypothetical protein
MSLQFGSVRTQFVTSCARLWQRWNTSPPPREIVIGGIVSEITAFMVAPTVLFRRRRDWGIFYCPSWRLTLNSQHVGNNNISYRNFLELCATIYHEVRHAEQFYRIAQGLALGRLTYPDVSRAEVIQATGGGNGVRSRIALFGGGRVAGTGTIAAASGLPTPALLTQWLSLPAQVTNHAHIHCAYFDNFTASAKPAWFKRETILKEVEDWMRATYKKTYSEMDVFAQRADDAPDALRRNVHLMYRALPEENDAFGVEELIHRELMMRIGP